MENNKDFASEGKKQVLSALEKDISQFEIGMDRQGNHNVEMFIHAVHILEKIKQKVENDEI